MAKGRTIEEYKVIAQSRGGKCLSERYINSKTKLEWQCSEGHIWEAVPYSILIGHWCPVCAGKAKHTIDEMKEFAKNKGGVCLSDEYIDGRTNLKWRCSDGHEWEAKSHDILQGTWCPHCTKYYTEEKCRFILENLLNLEFKKNRKVLNGYELDGYNSELRLAFEFHGRQHYKHEKFFHKTKEHFNKRQQLDLQKEQLCKDKNIRLIVIPYYEVETDNNLLNFIYKKIQILGIAVPVKQQDISFNGFYVRLSVLNDLRELAKSKGGICLAKTYVDNKEKLNWKCSNGHTFKMNTNNVRNGHWCPICAGLERLSIDQMRVIAKERGGKCLSDEYVNNKTPLKWQCSQGHIWEARPDSVRNGKWCLICSGKASLTIEEMQKIAKDRGGKCLSDRYVNVGYKLKWQCKEGHIWAATSNAIKQGQWCRACSGSLKLSIDDMKEIAKSRGGKCLSEEYKDNKVKLIWECARGHIWEASPNAIKSKGTWCPICARDVFRESKKRITIDEIKDIAKLRGGVCLSSEYKNGKTKLDWKCDKGHEWSATLESVKNAKSWCPICSRLRMKKN